MNTYERVVHVIAVTFDIPEESITPSMTISGLSLKEATPLPSEPVASPVDGLKSDSLNAIELTIALEEEFELSLDDTVSPNVQGATTHWRDVTVQELVDYINDHSR